MFLIYQKSTRLITDAFLVDHIEKNSPLIEEEVRRWRYLLWDDYTEYQQEKDRVKRLGGP